MEYLDGNDSEQADPPMTTTQTESAHDLRKRTEKLFRVSEILIPELTSPDEITRLSHELQLKPMLDEG